MHPESLYGERALRAGADGYAMKRESGARLLAAMRHVLAGNTHVSPELDQLILQTLSGRAGRRGEPAVERLSEREVFELVGQGFSTREIGDRLNVSMKTVETHREHIKEMLAVERTAELVQRAIRWMHHDRTQGLPWPDPASGDA